MPPPCGFCRITAGTDLELLTQPATQGADVGQWRWALPFVTGKKTTNIMVKL